MWFEGVAVSTHPRFEFFDPWFIELCRSELCWVIELDNSLIALILYKPMEVSIEAQWFDELNFNGCMQSVSYFTSIKEKP